MATKQFGDRVSISVSSVGDQLGFRCFVQNVRSASHTMNVRTWRSNRDGDKAHPNHLRKRQPRKLGAHFPGPAPVYWHPRVDGEELALLLCACSRRLRSALECQKSGFAVVDGLASCAVRAKEARLQVLQRATTKLNWSINLSEVASNRDPDAAKCLLRRSLS